MTEVIDTDRTADTDADMKKTEQLLNLFKKIHRKEQISENEQLKSTSDQLHSVIWFSESLNSFAVSDPL